MKLLLLFVLCFYTANGLYAQAQQKPGSGNTLSFNGFTNYMSAADDDGANDFTTNKDFTVECWVKINPVQADLTTTSNLIIAKSTGTAVPYGIYYINQSSPADAGKIVVAQYNETQSSSINSQKIIGDNKWHHIAFTRQGKASGIFILYVDGIFQGNAADAVGAYAASNTSLFIGGAPTLPPANFAQVITGDIDEVRIWDIGLTEQQVRERMCHKIVSSDVLYTNLVAYYNFDEITGSTAFDGTTNGNNGIIVSGAGRALSGAAIGDESSFAYDLINFFPLGRPYPKAGVAYGIQDSVGFSFTEEQASQLGSTIGVQVYLIKEKPNTLNGIAGIGTNDRYFGLFNCNNVYEFGAGIYNYSNNPFVTQLNESSLRLFQRDNNSANTWVTLGELPDKVANTFSTVVLGKEYIISSIDTVITPMVSIEGKNVNEGNTGNTALKLTVTLSSVSASAVTVQYRTANKTATAGSDYTAVTKSLSFAPGQTSKKVTVQILGDVTVEAAEEFYVILSSPVNATLGAADTATVRIKNDDVAAAVVSATSDAAAVSSMAVKLSPNPAKNILTITGLRAEKSSIEITDMQGRAVAKENTTSSIATVNIANLVPGMYMLKYFDGSSYKTVKFIKE